MFSFFNRQHERTLATLNQITLDAAERMQQDADRANRRAENAREELAEEQHSNHMKHFWEAKFLEGECYRLSDELADYKDLARHWGDGYEYLRRTLDQLVENWRPVDSPDEDLEARKARVKAMREDIWKALVADEKWPARREEKHQARIKQRRG